MVIIPNNLSIDFTNNYDGFLPAGDSSPDSPFSIKNEPTSGFRIVESDYDKIVWNKPKSTVLLLDPRGFMFNVLLNNYLYIIEHSDVVNGVIRSALVYSQKASLTLLLPVGSPLYEKTLQHTKSLGNNSISPETIQIGQVYSTDTMNKVLYLGYWPTYKVGTLYNGVLYTKEDEAIWQYLKDHPSESPCFENRTEYYPYYTPHNIEDNRIFNQIVRDTSKPIGGAYWFAYKNGPSNGFKFEKIRCSKSFPKNLSEHLPGCETEFDIERIKELMEHDLRLHPISKIVWKDYTFEEFEQRVSFSRDVFFSNVFFSKVFSHSSSIGFESVCQVPEIYNHAQIELVDSKYQVKFKKGDYHYFKSLREVYDYIQPAYYEVILDNGVVFKTNK